ncbi:unnamed protein product, partial [Durusdinium trenchii]
VCQRAFRSLIGLGTERYAKLKRAAMDGTAPPGDGRCLPRKLLLKTQKASIDKRSAIAEFLEQLYNTLSEPTPTVLHSDTQFVKPKLGKRKRKDESAEVKAEGMGPVKQEEVPKPLKFHRKTTLQGSQDLALLTFLPSTEEAILEARSETKHHMSDEHWLGDPMLYLPHALIEKIAYSGTVPSGSS